MLGFEKILLSFLPVPLSIIVYKKYLFNERKKSGTYFDAFLLGILQAAVLLLIFKYFSYYLSTENKILTAFINAALIEKLSAYLILIFVLRKSYSKLRINQFVFFGMFLGIGFSALENILYSIQNNSSMILLRLFSSVPLHITTCGMMGYFLGLREYYQTKNNRTQNLILAFLFPYLFHAIYDTCLLLGGSSVYFIGLELVFLILILEYLISKGISLPSKEELLKDKIGLEDYETIQLQPQYERWIINSMGKKNAEYVPLFLFHFSVIKTIFISTLILIICLFNYNQNNILEFLKLNLSPEEHITLFLIYPLVLAANLFLLGAINPDYFKFSIIRIPIIMEVSILQGSDTKSVIGSEITNSNSFLKTFDTLGLDHELEIQYSYSNYKSPPIKGKIIWENHEDFERPMGSLLEFDKHDFDFYKFLWFYNLYKIGKGILYNIKFPGFEKIRKLFIKESTVMEADNYYTAGTILFKEGDFGSKFYLLKKGNIEICKYSDFGKKYTIKVLESGEIFGEMSILGNQPRSATAVCMTNSVVATADGENLEALIKGNPEFSLKLIRTLAQRVGASERFMREKINELESEFQVYKESVEIVTITPNKPVDSTKEKKDEVEIPNLKKTTDIKQTEENKPTESDEAEMEKLKKIMGEIPDSISFDIPQKKIKIKKETKSKKKVKSKQIKKK